MYHDKYLKYRIKLQKLKGSGEDNHCEDFECEDEYLIASEDTKLSKNLNANKIIDKFLPKFPNVDDTVGYLQKMNKYTNSQTAKYIKKTAKILLGTGASISTAGLGGDIPIKVYFLLDKVYSVLLDIVNFLNDLKDAIRIFYDLFHINFTNGINGVECWVNYILDSYAGETKVYKKVCGLLTKLLSIIGSFIGDLISTFIPNDPGVVSLLLEKIITKGPSLIYKKIKNIYCTKISNTVQKILEDKEALEEFIVEIYDNMEECSLDPGNCLSELADTVDTTSKEMYKKIPSFMRNPVLKQSLKQISRSSKAVSRVADIIPEPPESVKKKISPFFNKLRKTAPFVAGVIHKLLGIFFAVLYFLITCAQEDEKEKK